MSKTEVLVVGAGPTGLLLACELARRGVECRIIDKARKRSQLSRALGIHSRSLEILDDLELADKALEQGFTLKATNIFRDGVSIRRLSLEAEPCPTQPYNLILVLEQHKTEDLLTQRLADLGVEIERRRDFRGLTQDASGVRARVVDGGKEEEIECTYLVGCDGARSRVRKALGIGFQGWTYPRAHTLGEVQVEWELPDEMHRFLGEGRDLVAVPLGDGRFRMTAWEDAAAPEEGKEGDIQHAVRMAPPSLAHLQEMADRLVPGTVKLSEPKSLLRYRIGSRLAESYRVGNAFIAGDAAHVHPPTGGQGMNTGLQDAYNLGWKLALVIQQACPEGLLETYQAERQPVGHWVVSNTLAATQDSAPEGSRFELGGRRFLKLRSRLLLARWSNNDVNYRQSPVMVQWPAARSLTDLQAGDRAPDSRVGLPGGETARLFEIFRGCQHHLLLFGGRDQMEEVAERMRADYSDWVEVHRLVDEEPGPGELLDLDGKVAKAYQAEGEVLILIRPDGYLCLRLSGEKARFILRFLENSFYRPVVST